MVIFSTESGHFNSKSLLILPWEGFKMTNARGTDTDYYNDPEWIRIEESSDWCETSIEEEEGEIYQYPLFNGSRCFPFKFANPLFGFTERPYCKNGFDQTNCSDATRVAGECLIQGYPSSVSTLMTCLPGMPGVCDDGMDLQCVQVSLMCRVHCHKLCDKAVDCDLSPDETISICGSLSRRKCIRRFGRRTLLGIPFAWVKDGVVDCEGGEDEADDWQMCGEGPTLRYTDSLHHCDEVFLCGPDGNEKFKSAATVCGAASILSECGKESPNQHLTSM